MGEARPGNVPKDNGYFDYTIVIGPVDYKKSAYNGLLMTTGTLGTTFAMHKIGLGKYTPSSLSMKNYFTLATVAILSQLSIDYGKARGYVPSGLKQ